VTIPKSYDASENAVILRLGNGSAVCDIYTFGNGQLPDWVQIWSPPLEKADLLVLPTHADDEYVMFGGLLPTYAGERGMAVQVVYLTNHRTTEPIREHERLDGLWTAGVTAYPIVGEFPDLYKTKASLEAAEATFGRQAVLAFQVEMIRRFKPDVIVGHDLNGEYGHGAHILNAQTLTEALEISAEASMFPESAQEYGVWDVPKTYLHLYKEGQVILDYNTPLDRFGGKTAHETAVEAFAKHATQTIYYTVRQSGTWQDTRKFGLYRSTVGPDTGTGDLFENIAGNE